MRRSRSCNVKDLCDYLSLENSFQAHASVIASPEVKVQTQNIDTERYLKTLLSQRDHDAMVTTTMASSTMDGTSARRRHLTLSDTEGLTFCADNTLQSYDQSFLQQQPFIAPPQVFVSCENTVAKSQILKRAKSMDIGL